jgi:hypothetical protein
MVGGARAAARTRAGRARHAGDRTLRADNCRRGAAGMAQGSARASARPWRATVDTQAVFTERPGGRRCAPDRRVDRTCPWESTPRRGGGAARSRPHDLAGAGGFRCRAAPGAADRLPARFAITSLPAAPPCRSAWSGAQRAVCAPRFAVWEVPSSLTGRRSPRALVIRTARRGRVARR